jgi:hypothetical protein
VLVHYHSNLKTVSKTDVKTAESIAERLGMFMNDPSHSANHALRSEYQGFRSINISVISSHGIANQALSYLCFYGNFMNNIGFRFRITFTLAQSPVNNSHSQKLSVKVHARG